MLKGNALLLGCLVFLGLAVHTVSALAGPMPVAMTSTEVQAAGDHAEVCFIGRIVDDADARDGRPMLTFEMANGYQAKVYIADDSQEARSYVLGSKYKVRATVLGPDFLTMNKPNSLVKAADYQESPTQVQVSVKNQMAYLQTSEGTQAVPAPNCQDGILTGRLVSINGVTRFTPEP